MLPRVVPPLVLAPSPGEWPPWPASARAECAPGSGNEERLCHAARGNTSVPTAHPLADTSGRTPKHNPTTRDAPASRWRRVPERGVREDASGRLGQEHAQARTRAAGRTGSCPSRPVAPRPASSPGTASPRRSVSARKKLAAFSPTRSRDGCDLGGRFGRRFGSGHGSLSGSRCGFRGASWSAAGGLRATTNGTVRPPARAAGTERGSRRGVGQAVPSAPGPDPTTGPGERAGDSPEAGTGTADQDHDDERREREQGTVV